MRALFVTDLHGSKWKYERIFEAAKDFKANVVINGGDMLPKNNDLFRQGEFITDYLDNHFARFNSAGIYYLCYLGNDDLRIFDQLFEETCNKYSFVVCLAQRKFEVGGYTFAGMNLVVDYPFRLKDRCRMDTDDYMFHESPEVSGRWHAKLGRTICIQPGQLNEFTYVTIDLSTMKFDRIKEQYVTLTKFRNCELRN